MPPDTTILYLTDNCLDPQIDRLVRATLLRQAADIPIISVSQQPIEFGQNICVGPIGRSWTSIFKQVLAGLAEVKTRFVSIAEHDCLYTNEHLSFIPPQADCFWVNKNCWLVQHGGNHPELTGMYSYWHKRSAMSQVVVARELFREYTELQVKLIAANQEAKRVADSGSSEQLQRYIGLIQGYRTRFFATVKPNLDIRHGGNFTGPKRGKRRCYELPYWGKWEEVLRAA